MTPYVPHSPYKTNTKFNYFSRSYSQRPSWLLTPVISRCTHGTEVHLHVVSGWAINEDTPCGDATSAKNTAFLATNQQWDTIMGRGRNEAVLRHKPFRALYNSTLVRVIWTHRSSEINHSRCHTRYGDTNSNLSAPALQLILKLRSTNYLIILNKRRSYENPINWKVEETSGVGVLTWRLGRVFSTNKKHEAWRDDSSDDVRQHVTELHIRRDTVWRESMKFCYPVS